MSKHKTRQEKMIASLHRKLQQQSSSTIATSEQKGHYTYTMNASTRPTIPTMVTTTNAPFIKHDLLKTALVTSAIVVLQLVLFFLLKTHIVKIPMISY